MEPGAWSMECGPRGWKLGARSWKLVVVVFRRVAKADGPAAGARQAEPPQRGGGVPAQGKRSAALGKAPAHFIFKHPPKHRNQPSRTERGPRTTLPNRKRRRSRRTPSAGAWSAAPRCSTRPGARQHAGGLESLVMEHLAGWAKPNAMGAPQAQDNSARCRSTDQLAGAQVLGAPRICASYCRVRAV
jgi:hypothetical protein